MTRYFLIIMIILCASVSAFGQWAASASGSAVAAAEINKKTAWQTGTAAPTSVNCTAAKDLYFDTTHAIAYWCSATGTPGTWTQFAVSTGGGFIDLPAGGISSGNLAGIWNDNRNGFGGIGTSLPSIKFEITGDESRASFRLPPNWTGTGVTVRMTGKDQDGNSGTISYNVQLGCLASGDSALSDPTFGTALVVSGTQGMNLTLEMSNSPLNIPPKCVANALARLILTRNTGYTGNHGIADVMLTW